jgi:hypothetical protein
MKGTNMSVEIPPYTLITYLRDKSGDPVGVVVARKNEAHDNFTIGYSMCRKGDRFSKKMGLKIALGRCEYYNEDYVSQMPHKLKQILPSFLKRCERYYK